MVGHLISRYTIPFARSLVSPKEVKSEEPPAKCDYWIIFPLSESSTQGFWTNFWQLRKLVFLEAYVESDEVVSLEWVTDFLFPSSFPVAVWQSPLWVLCLFCFGLVYFSLQSKNLSRLRQKGTPLCMSVNSSITFSSHIGSSYFPISGFDPPASKSTGKLIQYSDCQASVGDRSKMARPLLEIKLVFS